MTATSHPEYNDKTEALDVAQAFPEAIRGKSVIITGVNRGGIGFATATAFASQAPAHLVLAGRNSSKLQECIDELEQQYPGVGYRALKLDLASQKAVRASAEELLSWHDVSSIDILVNNAAIMHIPERTLSEDGIELHLATNHIGHFLLTNLIMPKLLKAAKVNSRGRTRVINVSSSSAEVGGMRWSDINFDKKSTELPEDERPMYKILEAWGIEDAPNMSYIPTVGYIQSKAANVLFGIGLTNRLYHKYGILSVGVHPGVIKTELGRHISQSMRRRLDLMVEKGLISYRPLGAGAATSLVAATDPQLSTSEAKDGQEGWGAYLKDCQISHAAHPRAKSREESDRLWELSERLVKEKFDW